MIHKSLGLSFLAFLLVGCGGSSGSSTPIVEPVSTQLKFKIAWTDNTRDVNAPGTAQSASGRIRVFGKNDVITSVNIDREIAGSYTKEYVTSGFGTTGTRYELVVLFFGVPRGYHGDSGGRTVAVVRKDVRVSQDGTLSELDGSPLAPIESVSTIASVKVGTQDFPFQTVVPVRSAIKAFAPDGVELGLPDQVGEIETVSGVQISKTPAGFLSQGYGRSVVRVKVGQVVSDPTEILTERTFSLTPIDYSRELVGGMPGGDLIGKEYAGSIKVVFLDSETGAKKFARTVAGQWVASTVSTNQQKLGLAIGSESVYEDVPQGYQIVDLQTQTVTDLITYDVPNWRAKSIAIDPADDNLVVMTVRNGIAGRILAYRSGALVATLETRAGNVYATGPNTFVMDSGPFEYPIEFSIVGSEVRINRAGDRNPRGLPFDAGVIHNGKIYFPDGMVLDTTTFSYSSLGQLSGLWLDPKRNKVYGNFGVEIKQIDLGTGAIGKAVSYRGKDVARGEAVAQYVAGDKTIYFKRNDLLPVLLPD